MNDNSKGSKFVIIFCWLGNNLSYYEFSINANGYKTHGVDFG